MGLDFSMAGKRMMYLTLYPAILILQPTSTLTQHISRYIFYTLPLMPLRIWVYMSMDIVLIWRRMWEIDMLGIIEILIG